MDKIIALDIYFPIHIQNCGAVDVWKNPIIPIRVPNNPKVINT
jgi:hypothetical protein